MFLNLVLVIFNAISNLVFRTVFISVSRIAMFMIKSILCKQRLFTFYLAICLFLSKPDLGRLSDDVPTFANVQNNLDV